MKRYVIKVGDETTSGSIVAAGEATAAHHGGSIACEGAPLTRCPKCNYEGFIVAAGPRLPQSIEGRQIALENDLGMCQCRPPPRLIASQSTMSQSMTADELAVQGYAPSGAPYLSHHDERITLRDSRTQQPLANVQYRLRDGARIFATGTTDGHGRTQRVVTNMAQNVLVEVQHDR